MGQCLLGRGIRYNNAILSLCISSYNWQYKKGTIKCRWAGRITNYRVLWWQNRQKSWTDRLPLPDHEFCGSSTTWKLFWPWLPFGHTKRQLEDVSRCVHVPVPRRSLVVNFLPTRPAVAVEYLVHLGLLVTHYFGPIVLATRRIGDHVANGLSSRRSFTHCFTVLSVCFLHRTLRMVGSLWIQRCNEDLDTLYSCATLRKECKKNL